ncbi:hypothetical protein L7F22_030438 [Adiantum nelumboides]|nr:hypothetical protein [Adiantum nelumboides]
MIVDMSATRTVLYSQQLRDASYLSLFCFWIAPVSRCLASMKAFICRPLFILSAHYSPSSANPMVSWNSVMQLTHVDTLIFIITHCKKQRNPHFALIMYTYICEQAAEMHPYLGNYLVPMLVDCGKSDIAQQVFDKLIQVNDYSCESLIQGYVGCRDYDRAFFILGIMRER